MKKFGFLIFTLSAVCFADVKEANSIISSSSEGREVVTENKLEALDINRGKDNLFYVETIMNYNKFYRSQNLRGAEVVGKTSNNLLVKNVVENTQNIESQNKSVEEFAVIKGYCFIQDEINVGKQPSSIRTECQTNIGAITMFANLVNLNEKASLIADPKYIEKNGYRFGIVSSIVTNEDKTSYNIATFVNDRKIANIGYSALSVSTDEIKNSTNEYLQALRESNVKQDIQYATTTDGAGNSYMQPIQTTNTQKPDPLDYLIDASINIAASTIKTTADIFKADLPYLYQIVPKTKIWIDLKVNKKGEYVK